MTLNQIVKEVILEEKQKNLKVYYNVDINIKEKAEPVPELNEPPAQEEPVVQEPVTQPVEQPVAQESKKEKGKLLTEATEYVNKADGELTVPYEDAMNIQTINDLIEYLSIQNHKVDKERSPIERVIDKKAEKESSGKIISEEVQDIILILAGVAGQEDALADLIDKEDKIIIEVTYGNNNKDNIGLKINKTPGTDVASTTIVKDGELLAGKFDPVLINKQILFFRNSLT